MNPNKIAVILNEVDNNGKPILVSLSKEITKDRINYDVNDIATIHGRNNLQATLDKATILYKNKNSDNYLTSLRLQLPPRVNVITSIESITQNTDNTSEFSFGQKGYINKSRSVRSQAAIEDYDLYDNDMDLLWDVTDKG